MSAADGAAVAENGEGEPAPKPRIDFVWGLGWMLFGGAIFYGSWTMDRLENLGINPYTAPGLLPGILGVVIAFCGAIMVIRAWRGGAFTRDRIWPRREGALTLRIALSVALCLGFAIGLVGRGLPFWVAAALFLAAHIIAFEWNERRSGRERRRGVLNALAIAFLASVVISTIFERLFLVPLP